MVVARISLVILLTLIIIWILNKEHNIISQVYLWKLKRDLKKIFGKLHYSVENNFVKDTSRIILDFKTRNTILKDFYKNFNVPDENGIKTGICGDLTYMAFDMIKDKYKKMFNIQAQYGQEPEFFFNNEITKFTHVFLTAELKNKATIIIDPSFKKIIELKKSNYHIDSAAKLHTLIPLKDFKIEMARISYCLMPLKIVNNEYVIQLAIQVRDESNFEFKIISRKKKFDTINDLFIIGRNNGVPYTFDRLKEANERTSKTPIINQDIYLIKDKLAKLVIQFKNMEIIRK